MEVSTAPQHQSDQSSSLVTGASARNAFGQRVAPLSSDKPLSPIRYGLRMGIGATFSAALILCCIVSVTGVLGPGRGWLNRLMVALSIVTGIFVGLRSWYYRRGPQPLVRGRCIDCGRELTCTEDNCPICGRAL